MMVDQAQALRELFCAEAFGDRNEAARTVHTVAVSSGKGGVGKTSIAVNLAVALSQSGRGVRLVDADFGLANAEVLLGVAPKYTLQDVIRGHIDARDAWTAGPGGISLLSAGSGMTGPLDMDCPTGPELMANVMDSACDGDVVVFDTSPGISASVVSLLLLVDEVLMVTNPEPTSLADTYAALKVLTSFRPEADVTLVANGCSSPAQASNVAAGLDNMCRRFLGRTCQRHEFLPTDTAVARAVASQRPFVTEFPDAPISLWLRKLALKLGRRIQTRTVADQDSEVPAICR